MTDKPIPDDEIEAVASVIADNTDSGGWDWKCFAEDAADAIRALNAVRAAKLPFPRGDRVRKKSGSQWQGRVVGYYSASRTQSGIAVESEREIGNVQVYPAEAFELVPEDSQ